MTLVLSYEGAVLSQEFSVSQSDSARAVSTDDVLVMLPDFNDLTRFVPFEWVGAGLVLDEDMITNDQLREAFCMF